MIQLQPLSELLPAVYASDEGKEPIPGFFAEFRGEVYWVTAVLERTAVLANTENRSERRLGKLTEVLVDPAVIRWRPDTGGRFTDGGQPDPAQRARLRGRVASQVVKAQKKVNYGFNGNSPAITDGQAVRAASDARALKDQARPRKEASSSPPKRAPNRSPEAKQRAKLVAQQARREGEPKLCRGCQTVKPRADFPLGRGTFSCLQCQDRTTCPQGHELTEANTVFVKGRWPTCRTCRVEGQRRYRQNNPIEQGESDRAYDRTYYHANRERIRERKRAHYLHSKERAIA